MATLIPLVHDIVMSEHRAAVAGKPVAFIFDGASHQGEEICILIRFVQAWNIKQLLVKLRHSDSSVDNTRYARMSLICFSHSVGSIRPFSM
jgi:hypothetical protein